MIEGFIHFSYFSRRKPVNKNSLLKFYTHYYAIKPILNLKEVLISSDTEINRLSNLATNKIVNIEKIIRTLTNQVNNKEIYIYRWFSL